MHAHAVRFRTFLLSTLAVLAAAAVLAPASAFADTFHGTLLQSHADDGASLPEEDFGLQRGAPYGDVVPVQLPAGEVPVNGQQVIVEGTFEDDLLVVSSMQEVVAKFASAPEPERFTSASRTRRMTVVRVTDKGKPYGVSRSHLKSIMEGADRSFRDYIVYVSNHRLKVRINYIDVEINADRVRKACTKGKGIGSTFTRMIDQVKDQAWKDSNGKVDLWSAKQRNYFHIISPRYCDKFTGVAYFGSSNGFLQQGSNRFAAPAWSQYDTPISNRRNRDNLLRVVLHEFGHNIGLQHTAAVTCRASSAGCRLGDGIARCSILKGGNEPKPRGECNLLEYGDPYDIMGRALWGRDAKSPRMVFYNNLLRWRMGWLKHKQLTYVRKSGVYLLRSAHLMRVRPGGRFGLIISPKGRVYKDRRVPTWCGSLVLEFRSGTGRGAHHGEFERFSQNTPGSKQLLIRTTIPEYTKTKGQDRFESCARTALVQRGEPKKGRSPSGRPSYYVDPELVGIKVGETFTDVRDRGTKATIEVLQVEKASWIKVRVTFAGKKKPVPAGTRPTPTNGSGPGGGSGLL